MTLLEQKAGELLKRHPCPGDMAGRRRKMAGAYGTGEVTDSVDPEGKGRVRVSLGSCGSEAWLPVLKRHAGEGSGLWALPEAGAQAAYILTDAERSEGCVLGYVSDGAHLPPEGSGKSAADSKVLQTRRHRIEIIEEEGKEEIRLESADGRMRAAIGKEGGISLVNELGGIRIKCRRLTMESGESLGLESAKGTELTSEEAMDIKTKKDAAVTGGKEIKVKGKKIRLNGSKGVTAEGKQIAVQDDRVTGFDVHIMVVPSGTGTATVPLPHPFIGKLKDGLAKDVSIKDRKCAVKGSAARHDDATHMQLPGTIKFQNSPKKEGKVTGGTSSKVKIEGKEAAVIGSQVTTCNDVGMQNNSTIIAMGASVPMPAIINPLNTEEYKREREEAEKKEPKFSGVKWSAASAEEGEEVELTASVQDIADGNTVTLQVFPEGKGPEDGVPLAQFPLTVRGGSVSARWSYRADRSGMPPESDPRFIFSAHCAWCNFEKSSNSLEVRLVRPEITKAEWRDADGNATSKGLVGEPLKLVAETKDMEGGVTFHVYDENKHEVFSKGADIADGRAEAEWTYHYSGEKLDAKPKYTFEVTGQRCKMVESSEVEIGAKIEVQFVDKLKENVSELDVILIDNSKQETSLTTDSDGIISKDDAVPGEYSVKTKNEYEIKQINGIDIYNITGIISVEKKSEVILNFEQKEIS